MPDCWLALLVLMRGTAAAARAFRRRVLGACLLPYPLQPAPVRGRAVSGLTPPKPPFRCVAALDIALDVLIATSMVTMAASATSFHRPPFK